MKYVFVDGYGNSENLWDSTICDMEKINNNEVYYIKFDSICDVKNYTYTDIYNRFKLKCIELNDTIKIHGVGIGALFAINFAVEFPQIVESIFLVTPMLNVSALSRKVNRYLEVTKPGIIYKMKGQNKKEVISLSKSLDFVDFDNVLIKVKCPTYIVCGAEDKIYKKYAIRLRDFIADAEANFIDNFSHKYTDEVPTILRNLVLEFHGMYSNI
ncbi:MAG: alpha/beta fold hydrolase [Lachnospirales bacterium]